MINMFNVFIAGVLNFISPCILPIVPLLVGYLLGEGVQSTEEPKKKNILSKLIHKKLLVFIFGFSSVFVLLGVLSKTLGIFINQNMPYINIIIGLFIILMGINYTGIINIGFLNKEFKMEKKNSGRTLNYIDAFIMGMFFALSWGPCAGPYLATALSAAANGKTILEGGLMLFVYSLGIAIPLYLAGISISDASKTFDYIKKNYKTINIISGLLLIGMGLYMIYQGTIGIVYLWNI